MVDYKHGDLFITSTIELDQHENTRILYVGDEAFLKSSQYRENSATFPAPQGLMQVVDNWYSIHQNYLIVEVMDAGLRMRPDLVVFNYADIFLAGHDEQAIDIIIGSLKAALNCGVAVAVVYNAAISAGLRSD